MWGDRPVEGELVIRLYDPVFGGRCAGFFFGGGGVLEFGA